MNVTKALKGLSNLALRAATLFFRFILSFYIVKFLGLDASGIFGLALGFTSIAPALVGWGLNYFIARDVVGQPKEKAGGLIKSRLLVTTLSLAATSAIALLAMSAFGVPVTRLYLLIAVLVWLETYALDVHMPLIAQGMAVEANILVFIRSALWVPVVIGMGMASPSFRTIEWVLASWAAAYIPMLAALAWFLRTWPMGRIATRPVERDWIANRLKGSWFIYISDLSIVGLMYADRYIVNFMLGLTLTGAYTFFWSLTNALQTLVTTAVVHLALPLLFDAYRNGDMARWKQVMRHQFIKTLTVSLLAGIAVFLAAEIILRFMDLQALSEHRLLFVLMLGAAIVRSCSELLNTALTSLNKDSHYATINILGVVLAMGSAYIGMLTMGLEGAGVAALATALIISLIRILCLLRFTRQFEALH